MKRHVIITARSSSTRLPCKHLYQLIDSRDTFDLMQHRLLRNHLSPIWALPDGDDLYYGILAAREYRVCAPWGPEPNDVLRRVIDVAKIFTLPEFAFVCGDSPLIDGDILENMWDTLNGQDMVYNVGPRGMRILIAKTEAAIKFQEMIDSQHEHAFSLLQQELPVKYTRFTVDKSRHDFSLDTKEDLEFLRAVLYEAGPDAKLGDYLAAADSVVSCDPQFKERRVALENPDVDPAPEAGAE